MEVECRAGDRGNLAGRDEPGIDGRVTVRVQGQHMAEDVARARQVEVGMLRQVDGRRLVGYGLEGNLQSIVVRERVRHRHVQRTGIALLAIHTPVLQHQAGTAVVQRSGAPQDAVVAVRSAMEVVGAIVDG